MRSRWLLALVAVVAALAVYLWPDAPATQAPEVAAPRAQAANLAGTRHDPKTLAPAAIAGTVRARGKPLAGAAVCLVEGEDRRCVTSSATGDYRLEGVPPDDAQVAASLARYRPVLAEVPALAAGETRTVDLDLSGTALELTGVVEDILGGPIANAVVTGDGARVETDAQGRFAIWIAPKQGPRSVEVRAQGYGPRTQRFFATTHVVIALSPESTITGKVVDGVTGAAVAGARVRVEPRGRETTTAADGTFTLDGLASEDLAIEAMTASRYGRLEHVVALGVGERREVVIRVQPAHAVVATVEVVGDATLCHPRPTLEDWTFTVAKPWRDERGRYHFDGLPPGRYQVALGCAAQVPPITVADADVELTWRVETGGALAGKIVFAREPGRISSVDVALARVGSTRPPITVASANGAFAFDGLPAGTYELRAAMNRKDIAPPVRLEIVNGKRLEHDLVIDLPARARLTGTMTFQGKPFRIAFVQVQPVAGGEAQTADVRDGMFEVDVPAGEYRLEASGPEGTSKPATVSLRAGETRHVALALEPSNNPERRRPGAREPVTFRGSVVDGSGAAIAGAIVASPEQAGTPAGVDRVLRATTDATGRFELRAPGPSLRVDAFRVGGPRTSTLLVASAPSTIVLDAGRTLGGTVARADGSPAARFEIRVGTGGLVRSFAHTGGRFTVPDPAEYPLVLTPIINGLPGTPVTVTAASARQEIALALPATVTVTGRIVDGETRRGIANVRIAGRKLGEGWSPWFIHPDQVTDAEGRFTLRELPPGAMMLELSPPVDTWSQQTVNVTIPAANGDLGEYGLAQTARR